MNNNEAVNEIEVLNNDAACGIMGEVKLLAWEFFLHQEEIESAVSKDAPTGEWKHLRRVTRCIALNR